MWYFETVEQVINITDSTKPTISGTITATDVEGCEVSDATPAVTTITELEALGVTISDNCTSNANLIVTSTDASTGTCPIVLTRTYTVTDTCGNFETVEQVINITDSTKPTISGTITPTYFHVITITNRKLMMLLLIGLRFSLI
ncbi:hypothetical protein APS56_01710 [Pseudalgibacter alginicilyticus]|uniref:HYR domain-containing protein n=1 Tax=Pseudalgibacter alginicilyticus TaxID=1736674 RepID=A0A0P0CHX3_9FLAO|nr:hypothetical protein [Pseudalgibacter alginicilyticus]ALJ03943.1 hypothetical protein APS56_01710 [Pseudalgibacter alginicilyticus]